MGERNDLIMELTEIAQDRHGAKNTHLLSWLEKGYFHCQHGSEEWCQGDYLDSARAYIERLEAVAKDALTTIASLSEALAEAEKKGAEDWQPIETAPRGKNGIAFMMLAFGPPGDQTVSEGMHFNGRFYAASVFHKVNPNDGRNYAFREHEVHPTHWRPTLAPPRDLSQGGQHG